MSELIRKLVVCLCAASILVACEKTPSATAETLQLSIPTEQVSTVSNEAIEAAYAKKQSDVQVAGEGTVVKLLPDDNKGSRHQKFLVSINERQTLLFAHNIDLADRVPLKQGDRVSFSGEYVYNPKGGILHWTHLDPQGQHEPGFIMLQSKKYQ